ncbi:MAG: pyridoxal-phosphate dependent enzyme, partial [Ignavibacterium sp.]
MNNLSNPVLEKQAKSELKYFPQLKDIEKAKDNLNGVVQYTPLTFNHHLSERYKCNIHLKREDLQTVRSYKIRGAYNKINSLSEDELKRGVVCASAGNHAQGVAYSCKKAGIHGTIFMSQTTPQQKIRQVEMFGNDSIEIKLVGDSYDDAYDEALNYAKQNQCTFIHPFDDEKVIEGQGTVGLEILEKMKDPIDILFIPVGGGGLASGVGPVFKQLSPQTKIIGVEPSGAPAMKTSLEEDKIITLDKIDNFVDGAVVKRVGDLTFNICRDVLTEVVDVEEGA